MKPPLIPEQPEVTLWKLGLESLCREVQDRGTRGFSVSNFFKHACWTTRKQWIYNFFNHSLERRGTGASARTRRCAKSNGIGLGSGKHHSLLVLDTCPAECTAVELSSQPPCWKWLKIGPHCCACTARLNPSWWGLTLLALSFG